LFRQKRAVESFTQIIQLFLRLGFRNIDAIIPEPLLGLHLVKKMADRQWGGGIKTPTSALSLLIRPGYSSTNILSGAE
jgi:hypothetical protein